MQVSYYDLFIEKQKQDKYFLDNKDILGKQLCTCGLIHNKSSHKRHLKTQEHQDRINYPNGFKITTTDGNKILILHTELTCKEQRHILDSYNFELNCVFPYRKYRELKALKKVLNIYESL